MSERMKTCTYILKGTRCKCYALKNDPDGLCYFHSPLTKKQRELSSRRGGLVCKEDIKGAIEIKSGYDILTLLNQVINAVKQGKLDPKVANSIFYGSNISLKAIELHKVQARLEEISRDIEQNRKWGQNLPADWDCLDLDEEPKKLNE